jgi:hypothetical protein
MKNRLNLRSTALLMAIFSRKMVLLFSLCDAVAVEHELTGHPLQDQQHR